MISSHRTGAGNQAGILIRVQEGDKNIVELEYQQKVKNAVWDAAPDFGLIVAGGNPVTMAVSLASQVGIGYMNYRRNMAEYELDHDKAFWRLQRSAMEQFNGLRRELFDTAWRLAKEYHFEDRYRLTERQIHQYNDILMDNEDLIRKYERMDAIKDNFEAYPPFWYYFGNTAALIAEKKNLSEDSRNKFRESAKQFFETYRTANKECKLLREDHIAATCALEYASLLDLKSDRQIIQDLVKEAVAASCSSNDIMQLGVCTLLSIGAYEKAAQYLKTLVNENHNRVLNGQILSSVLVAKYTKNSIGDEQRKVIKSEYELLTTRVKPVYLYSLPDNCEFDEVKSGSEFIIKQKFVIVTQYYTALKEYLGSLRSRFEEALPYTHKEEQSAASFIQGETPEAVNQKTREAERSFHSDPEAMKDVLYYAEILETQFKIFNEMLTGLYGFEFINNKDELTALLTDKILEKKDRLLYLNSRLVERTFSIDDYRELVGYTFSFYVESFVRNYFRTMFDHLKRQDSMQGLSAAEMELNSFCLKHGIRNMETLFEEDEKDVSWGEGETYISLDLLGASIEEAKKVKEEEDQMLKCIRDSEDSFLKTKDSKKIEVIYRDDPQFPRTLKKAGIYKSNYRRDGLAYIDDRTLTDSDLLLTKYGVYPVWRSMRWKFAPYKDIVATDDGYLQFYGKVLFDKLKCGNWNIDALIRLFSRLNSYTEAHNNSNVMRKTIETVCDDAYKQLVIEPGISTARMISMFSKDATGYNPLRKEPAHVAKGFIFACGIKDNMIPCKVISGEFVSGDTVIIIDNSGSERTEKILRITKGAEPVRTCKKDDTVSIWFKAKGFNDPKYENGYIYKQKDINVHSKLSHMIT